MDEAKGIGKPLSLNFAPIKENTMSTPTSGKYNEDSIRSLDWKDHLRFRPGMYIGKLGDGSSPDDGIYVLIKEVIYNSIDEYAMGFGKTIEVTIKKKTVTILDHGRGMPLGKV